MSRPAVRHPAATEAKRLAFELLDYRGGRGSIAEPIAAANGAIEMTRERSPIWVWFALALLALGTVAYLMAFYSIEYLMTFF